jgi:hypothetical protein
MAKIGIRTVVGLCFEVIKHGYLGEKSTKLFQNGYNEGFEDGRRVFHLDSISILEKMDNMAMQSLDPKTFDKWQSVQRMLIDTRDDLK